MHVLLKFHILNFTEILAKNPLICKNFRFYMVGTLKHYLEILKLGNTKRGPQSGLRSTGVRAQGLGV